MEDFTTKQIVLFTIKEQSKIQGHCTMAALISGVQAPYDEMAKIVEELADERKIRFVGSGSKRFTA